MTTPTQRPLAELLTELQAAVRAGGSRATALEQTILQRLATEAADRDGLERRVRTLMAELDQPVAAPSFSKLEPFNLERGSPPPDADGAVYPVWFATNRKPATTVMGTPEKGPGSNVSGDVHRKRERPWPCRF